MKHAYIFIACMAMFFSSCSYDYDMPDMSNAKASVSCSVTDDLTEKLKSEALETVKNEYGYNPYEYSQERWEESYTFKDASGNILSEGQEAKAKTLSLDYTFTGRISDTNWTYYKLCSFHFEKAVNVVIKPATNEFTFDVGDQYTLSLGELEGLSYYTLSVSDFYLNVLLDDIENMGYTSGQIKYYYNVTEKDANGNVMSEITRDNSGPFLTTAKTIEITLEITKNGAVGSKGETLITYKFEKPFTLDGKLKTTAIALSASDEYTKTYSTSVASTSRYTISQNGFLINVVYPNIKELGYTSGQIDDYYKITEKDSEGNVLKTFTSNKSSDYIYVSEENAKTIEVSLEITKRGAVGSKGETLITYNIETPFELKGNYSLTDIVITPDLKYKKE